MTCPIVGPSRVTIFFTSDAGSAQISSTRPWSTASQPSGVFRRTQQGADSVANERIQRI